MRTLVALMAAALLAACPPPGTGDGGAGGSGGAGGGGAGGGGSTGGAGGGGGAAAPFDAGPEPTSTLRPIPGELTIIQLDLSSGIPSIGEAAIVVGPDGTTVLIDVGNNSHDDDVRGAVLALNTVDLTPARGFTARDPLAVDWVVLTHFHGDHIGAMTDLLTSSQALKVQQGIVHRGFVDLGAGTNEADVTALCTLVRTPALSPLDVPLCTAASQAPCSGWTQLHPATDCPGLRAPPLQLGGGATLTFLAADGRTASAAAPAFPNDTSNQENARSIVGEIHHGAFRYHFAGDLTGAGTTAEPDVETFVAAQRDGGADVIHVNHHARNTSSNAAFVAALAPSDGRARNAVAGINPAYLGSPQPEPVSAWLDTGRLGDGQLWVTRVASGGTTHARIVDAKAAVIVQTIAAGAGYRVQAASTPPVSRAFTSAP
jgi:Metallo-beta-lactamase superfamily